MLNYIPKSGPNINYDLVNMRTKHIEIVVLVPKKAAVAMYYMEGSMKPEEVIGMSQIISQGFLKPCKGKG